MFSGVIWIVKSGAVSMKKVPVKLLTGTTICIVLAASFFIFVEPDLGILPSIEVSFERIGHLGGRLYTRDNFTIRDSLTWETLWLDSYSGHTQVPEVPEVDFSSELLIVVFQGLCSSTGYLTNITRITMTLTYYTVYVDEIHPGEDCVVATVLTSPHDIVKISDLPLNLRIRFIYNITVRDCG